MPQRVTLVVPTIEISRLTMLLARHGFEHEIDAVPETHRVPCSNSILFDIDESPEWGSYTPNFRRK